MMKALVTGATGFVGLRLVDELLRRRWKVRCLTRSSSKAKLPPNVEVWNGDVTDAASLRGIADDVDVVFHLAAIGDVNTSGDVALPEYRKVNVVGTKNLLDECRSRQLKKIVHFSSAAAMGEPKGRVVDERCECLPETPYEISKRESELVAMDAFRRGRVPVTILRPVMITGGTERNESKKLLTSVKMRLVPVIGDGRRLIHSVRLADVVDAAISAARRGRAGQMYILCGSSETWDDAVRRIARERKMKVRILHIPTSIARPAVALSEAAFNIVGIPPIFTKKRLERLETRFEYDCRKARTELGLGAKKR